MKKEDLNDKQLDCIKCIAVMRDLRTIETLHGGAAEGSILKMLLSDTKAALEKEVFGYVTKFMENYNLSREFIYYLEECSNIFVVTIDSLGNVSEETVTKVHNYLITNDEYAMLK